MISEFLDELKARVCPIEYALLLFSICFVLLFISILIYLFLPLNIFILFGYTLLLMLVFNFLISFILLWCIIPQFLLVYFNHFRGFFVSSYKLFHLIPTTLIITLIIAFVVFLFVNRRKWKNKEERSAESFIFDLGNCIFKILNSLTLFTIFKHLFVEDLFLFELDATTALKAQLDNGVIPQEVREFRNNDEPITLQLPENAKVFAYDNR
ncbi:MAG: hypothetical protein JW878_08845 [Methanomicrobia archaeon]|nr:hypothetical protein [Methanomicrobia archaeon]